MTTRKDVIATLKTLEPRLRDSGVEALYLYGSFSRDEASAGSDIDLIADFSGGQSPRLHALMTAQSALEQAFPGHAIGLSTRAALVPLYRPFIERSAMKVF